MEIILNKANFEKEVLKTKVLVLVDFWAQWCGPCQIVAPVLSELSKEYQGRLKVGKLNVDENPGLASQYQIQSIPNLKIFKNGEIVDEIIGALPKNEIDKRLKKYL